MPRSTDRGRARGVALAALLALGACVPAGHLAGERAAAPTFDPLVFFAGPTEGRGSLKILTRRRQTVLVAGQGTVVADGAIVLEQDVRRDGGAPTHRTWRLRRVGSDRVAGTLTDATGPVRGEVTGNRLHLAFAMKGGLQAQQWLYLRPGGQVARNRMVVTKFGLPVASLDETIRRVPS